MKLQLCKHIKPKASYCLYINCDLACLPARQLKNLYGVKWSVEFMHLAARLAWHR